MPRNSWTPCFLCGLFVGFCLVFLVLVCLFVLIFILLLLFGTMWWGVGDMTLGGLGDGKDQGGVREGGE